MDEAALADIFAGFWPIRIKRMFGGLGLYHDGRMFALVADGQIYLKTDDAFARELEARGCQPFRYEAAGRRPVVMSYWSLPEPALDDIDEAAALARRASAIAQAAAPPRGARSKARKPATKGKAPIG